MAKSTHSHTAAEDFKRKLQQKFAKQRKREELINGFKNKARSWLGMPEKQQSQVKPEAGTFQHQTVSQPNTIGQLSPRPTPSSTEYIQKKKDMVNQSYVQSRGKSKNLSHLER